MGDAWLLWLGGVVALVFLVPLASAGYAVMGLVLGVAVWLPARRAVTLDASSSVDGSLRRTCNRLPFCDCK